MKKVDSQGEHTLRLYATEKIGYKRGDGQNSTLARDTWLWMK